jgi:hypothetical protein
MEYGYGADEKEYLESESEKLKRRIETLQEIVNFQQATIREFQRSKSNKDIAEYTLNR